MDQPLAIILAAGKGKRMVSDLPKVLIPVCGRPMIRYVINAARAAGIGRILIVIGFRGSLVRQELSDEPDVEFVTQREQLGTGHAVMACREQLLRHDGPVMILAGDSPMTQASSLRALLESFAARQPACLLGTAVKPDPTGLGRILRDENGRFLGIVEEKDATPQQRAIQEVNLSNYVFRADALLTALEQLTANNVQGEYYLTDCPGVLHAAGEVVEAICVLKPCESLSINTPAELAAAEAEMKSSGEYQPPTAGTLPVQFRDHCSPREPRSR